MRRGWATPVRPDKGEAFRVTFATRRTQRRSGWRNLALSLTAALLAQIGGAGAQTWDLVPVPRPNPFAAAGPQPAAASEPRGLRRIFGRNQDSSAAPPVVPSPNSPFTPAQQVALANISNYFNSFDTMQGEFIQVGPRGEQSEGVFVIDKPGKIRFHYKPPVKLDVIADGRSVAVRDNRANTQDLYPLSKTPLRYLLSDRIDLTSSKVVDRVREEADLISLEIEEKGALVKGKLTLIFDSKTNELRQWIVTDAQGLNTSVAIFNTTTGTSPDPGLFKIYLAPPSQRRDR